MSWHYMAVTYDEDGYFVGQRYRNDDGSCHRFTEQETPHAHTVEELIADLEAMLADIKAGHVYTVVDGQLVKETPNE